MKKYMFKELRKKWVQYNKRSKIREKEYIKKQRELLKQQKKRGKKIPENIVII
jgi:hypothetical protein